MSTQLAGFPVYESPTQQQQQQLQWQHSNIQAVEQAKVQERRAAGGAGGAAEAAANAEAAHLQLERDEGAELRSSTDRQAQHPKSRLKRYSKYWLQGAAGLGILKAAAEAEAARLQREKAEGAEQRRSAERQAQQAEAQARDARLYLEAAATFGQMKAAAEAAYQQQQKKQQRKKDEGPEQRSRAKRHAQLAEEQAWELELCLVAARAVSGSKAFRDAQLAHLQREMGEKAEPTSSTARQAQHAEQQTKKLRLMLEPAQMLEIVHQFALMAAAQLHPAKGEGAELRSSDERQAQQAEEQAEEQRQRFFDLAVALQLMVIRAKLQADEEENAHEQQQQQRQVEAAAVAEPATKAAAATLQHERDEEAEPHSSAEQWAEEKAAEVCGPAVLSIVVSPPTFAYIRKLVFS